MSNKVIKCNSCGFPFDASSASQRRIKCPKCGVVNVIGAAVKSAFSVNNENFIGGFPVTADWIAIHKDIVSLIFENHETIPSDFFQEFRITGVDRLNVPCYLFECNASIRYSYKIGNTQEGVPKGSRKFLTESHDERADQNDIYDYNGYIIVSGNSEVIDAIRFIYKEPDLSKLVDLAYLNTPSDVRELSFDVPKLNALNEVKEIIGKTSQSQIKKLLKNNRYKDIQIRDDFRIEYRNEPSQVLLPLIHVMFEYKDKTGDIWFSGDAEYLIVNNLPSSNKYKISRKKIEEQRPDRGSWIIAIFSMIVVFLVPLGIYMIINMIKKSKKVEQELTSMKNEHDRIFSQFIQKQIPLNGVLQKELQGKPEAFPEKKDLRKMGIHFREST